MEYIKEIPHSQRISWVSAIQETIPRERIRVQITQDKPIEMWGFVWLNRLPFCFRAWLSVKRLDFLENGLKIETGWGYVHRPYEPLAFVPSVLTEGVTEDDMLYVVRGLKVDNGKIKAAEENGRIPGLFKDSLTSEERTYRKFDELYTRDFSLRNAYTTAVSLVCDEKEANLHLTLLTFGFYLDNNE